MRRTVRTAQCDRHRPGAQPHGWANCPATRSWNKPLLDVIVVWPQTDLAMVLFSIAIEGVPEEILQGARLVGATEIQRLFRIMIPQSMATIIAFTARITIFTLKVFDVV
jgi:alpha-glucoside transport system permease protein